MLDIYSGKKLKLVTGISGGVDSSTAAGICLEQGHELVGITMLLRPDIPDSRDEMIGIEDIQKAVDVCDALGIKHELLDYKKQFKELILKYCWDEYTNARTPNPCILCNEKVKFGLLLDYAETIGADGVVTGHHARIIRNEAGYYCLQRGNDPAKNQTYFLYRLSQNQLAKSCFPVGGMTKDEVRQYAREHNLPTADSRESQDACFSVKGECFSETLKNLFKGKAKPGRFFDDNNKVVGKHKGIHIYTIGQRKGLGVALGKPGYVRSIDGKSGDIHITTQNEKLLSNEIRVDDLVWQLANFAEKPFECKVQVRYRSQPVEAKVIPSEDGQAAKIIFNDPQRAITAGQSAVFYDDDKVIAGGIIV